MARQMTLFGTVADMKRDNFSRVYLVLATILGTVQLCSLCVYNQYFSPYKAEGGGLGLGNFEKLTD